MPEWVRLGEVGGTQRQAMMRRLLPRGVTQTCAQTSLGTGQPVLMHWRLPPVRQLAAVSAAESPSVSGVSSGID